MESYYINGCPVQLDEWETTLAQLKKLCNCLLMMHFELDNMNVLSFLLDKRMVEDEAAILIKVSEIDSKSSYIVCYGVSNEIIRLARLLHVNEDIDARFRIVRD